MSGSAQDFFIVSSIAKNNFKGDKTMDAINVGWLSILPPIIAIVLALITKEVISSLIIGILSGTLIYSFATGGGIVKAIEVIFSLMAEKL